MATLCFTLSYTDVYVARSHIRNHYFFLLSGLFSIHLYSTEEHKKLSPADIPAAADELRPGSVSVSTWIKCTAGTERASGLAF